MKARFVSVLATAGSPAPHEDNAAMMQSRASANLHAFATASRISAAPTPPRPKNATNSERLVLLS